VKVPTYQYQCTECGEALEVFQKFTDDALTVCPNCEGKLRKVYSAVGIVFKGSGFYRTDSRNSSASSTASSGAKSETSSSSAKSEGSSSAGGSSNSGGSSNASGSGSASSSSGSSSSSSGSSSPSPAAA
jgi:putative FmdB family regulatory protein